MDRKIFSYKNSVIAIVLICALVIPVVGKATDVSTLKELTDAISRKDNYIKLTTKIALGNTTLTINSGVITLDLDGNELSMGADAEKDGICIIVEGGDLIVLGGGTISAKGGRGQNKNVGKGGQGKSAYAILQKGGTLKIGNITLMAIGGDGGSGGLISGPGAQGDAYPIKSNNSIDNIIPEGYALGLDGSFVQNYNITELKVPNGSSLVSVELINYKLIYDEVGGTNPTNALTSYTKEKADISFPPIPYKIGYDFKGWYSGNTLIKDATLLFPRATMNPYEWKVTARWEAIKYKITYNNLNDGSNTENPTTYTIENELPLKDPTRIGYQFMGWYDNASFGGNKITTIAKGSTDAKVFYAKWSEIYSIKYTPGEDHELPTGVKNSYIVEETPFDLPKLTPPNESYTFMGWCVNEDLTDTPITNLPKGMTGNKNYYAKWNKTYCITYHWQVPDGKETMNPMEDQEVSYTKDDAVTLLTPENGAYKVANWYDNPELEGSPVPPVISKGTEKDFEFYAKWKPIDYSIKFEPYYGSFPTGTKVPASYTYESEDINLPSPVRSGYTFAGWYTDMALTQPASLPAKSKGNKTFYAKWVLGDVISIVKSVNGKIQVKSGSTEIKDNDKVGVGVALRITAIPDSSIYKLTKLKVGDKIFTSNPVDTVMPASGGLTISAEFADSRPTVFAPKIITTPVSTDFIAPGENVTVALENTDNTSTLYYSIDGSTPKLYSKPFQVSSLTTGKTIQVVAYAKKEGYKDGIAKRDIVFGAGKVTITFDLPKGITAVNPEGGEVVSAIATGGTFEFKLVVDRNYFESLDSLVVTVGGKSITPNSLGVYTLTGNTTNVTVKVTGITGVTHKIQLSQTANGHIYFTSDENAGSSQTVNHGDRVSITAKPDEGYKFFAWKDGAIDNPRSVIVEKDTTIQARFVEEDPGYLMVLPVLNGAKVKPLTGYSMEVKKGGTFKFYISKEADYNESVPEVFANGEKLTVYKDVYSIYNISRNFVIAVSGIKLNEAKLNLPEGVTGVNLETGKDIKEGGLTPVSMIMIRANAPEGKKFSIWNDGKADNPRIIAAKDALQLLPLFVTATDEALVKVELPILAGAGVGAVNANSEAVTVGGDIQLKLVVLPAYSNSQVKVTANGEALDADLSLRASSETKTLFYNLKKLTKDVKLEVSGLEVNDYNFSVKQSTGGTIRANKTGKLKHGTVVALTATPASGSLFLKWSDGNTMNPYAYTVTGDYEISAQFGNSEIPLDNEDVQMKHVRIYVSNKELHVETDRSTVLNVWNLAGMLVKNVTLPEGHSAYSLPVGNYLVKAGKQDAVKISIP